VGDHGTVYVGSWDNDLYAISGGAYGPAPSSWPEFRHDNGNTGRTR